eukprot:9284400-Alexandrium_andersonii.AAC.1
MARQSSHSAPCFTMVLLVVHLSCSEVDRTWHSGVLQLDCVELCRCSVGAVVVHPSLGGVQLDFCGS